MSNDQPKSAFEEMPNDLKAYLVPMLGIKALGRICQLNTGAKTFFQPLLYVEKFWDHVANSQWNEALAIATTYPNLLLQKRDITIRSRTFINITLLQYALWAWDTPLRDAICKHLPSEEIKEQLEQLESNGIRYEFDNGKIKKETHYDFGYIHASIKFAKESCAWSISASDMFWLGTYIKEKELMPTYIANQCEETEKGFDPGGEKLIALEGITKKDYDVFKAELNSKLMPHPA